MDFCTLVWMLWFIWKNKTINPFFDEFGAKRTLLCILVVFGSFRLDLKLFSCVLDFRTDFRVGNKANLVVCPSGKLYPNQ